MPVFQLISMIKRRRWLLKFQSQRTLYMSYKFPVLLTMRFIGVVRARSSCVHRGYHRSLNLDHAYPEVLLYIARSIWLFMIVPVNESRSIPRLNTFELTQYACYEPLDGFSVSCTNLTQSLQYAILFSILTLNSESRILLDGNDEQVRVLTLSLSTT